MYVRKAVITAAGLGTRLLPVTKEMPKEMLPLFTFTGKNIGLKPVIQIVFESLYECGFREFCFVVGRGKRILEDHFTPDVVSIRLLENRGLGNRAESLKKFYELVCNSKILFVNQPEPKGFGHAALCAEPFIGSEPFLLHAGDIAVLSEDNSHVTRLISTYVRFNADVAFLVEEVKDPREYGVVVGEPVGGLEHVLKVVDIVEKPEKPPSNLAVVAIYVFKPIVFDYLRRVRPDERGEVQLTAAIRLMIREGRRVYAVKLAVNEVRLDVGNPVRYWEALELSYRRAIKMFSARSCYA